MEFKFGRWHYALYQADYRIDDLKLTGEIT
jgi:hypothetical protein